MEELFKSRDSRHHIEIISGTIKMPYYDKDGNEIGYNLYQLSAPLVVWPEDNPQVSKVDMNWLKR